MGNKKSAQPAIDGQAISDSIKALRHVALQLEPVSEREYIERALRIANWNGENYAEFQDLEAAMLCGAAGIEAHPTRRAEPGDEPFKAGAVVTGRERALRLAQLYRNELQPLAKDIEAFRRQLAPIDLRYRMVRGQLVPLNDSDAQQRREASSASIHHAGGILALPITRITKQPHRGGRARAELSVDYIFLAEHLDESLTLVRDLLTASNKPLGDLLRQCQLESCGQLFLIEKASHRPPQYCPTKSCMTDAHALKAPERMKRSREDRKEAKRLGISVKEYRKNKRTSQ